MADWDAIPASLAIDPRLDVRFRCDGSTDLSDSLFWAEHGKAVETCSVAMVDAGLAVRVQLRASDVIGGFGYCMRFPTSRGVLYVFLRPTGGGAEINFETRQQEWLYLGPVAGSFYEQTPHSIQVVVPWEMLQGHVLVSELARREYSIHLEYIQGDRRELFFLEGTGTPTMLLEERTDLIAD
ncbi:hypothetical protein ACFLSF_03930 [Candidatus Bipolaricaulota bacterium]